MNENEKVALGFGLLAVAVYLFDRTDRATGEAVANGGTLNVKLTGYWPFKQGLNAAERLMEGGITDRTGNPLHTLEDHIENPSEHPYVSVAGDYKAWPYGQRIEIPNWPGVIFRVVDTGGNFFGAKKVYRVAGYEPLDICVRGPETVIDPSRSTATVAAGDSFAEMFGNTHGGPTTVQGNLFQGQVYG